MLRCASEWFRCAVCGNPIILGVPQALSAQRLCSGKCRKKRERERRKQGRKR